MHLGDLLLLLRGDAHGSPIFEQSLEFLVAGQLGRYLLNLGHGLALEGVEPNVELHPGDHPGVGLVAIVELVLGIEAFFLVKAQEYASLFELDAVDLTFAVVVKLVEDVPRGQLRLARRRLEHVDPRLLLGRGRLLGRLLGTALHTIVLATGSIREARFAHRRRSLAPRDLWPALVVDVTRDVVEIKLLVSANLSKGVQELVVGEPLSGVILCELREDLIHRRLAQLLVVNHVNLVQALQERLARHLLHSLPTSTKGAVLHEDLLELLAVPILLRHIDGDMIQIALLHFLQVHEEEGKLLPADDAVAVLVRQLEVLSEGVRSLFCIDTGGHDFQILHNLHQLVLVKTATVVHVIPFEEFLDRHTLSGLLHHALRDGGLADLVDSVLGVPALHVVPLLRPLLHQL